MRIIAYILIIATFVTIADLVLDAVVPEIHKALGAFIALIVVNCMILGRQEAFASKQPVGRAILDAVGTGLGFIIALCSCGRCPRGARQRLRSWAFPSSGRASSRGSS